MTNPQTARKLLIGASLSLANLALIGGFALSGITAPANAQEWIWKDGACPNGYSQGQPGRAGQSDSDKCYKGSFGTYTPPTYDSITKANQMDRCPVGYWTDENNIKSCVSPYQTKAPSSRLKKGGACKADEVDEWGVYCTSRLHNLSRSEAENTAVADVNNLFVLSNGGTSPQGADYRNTPGIVALFSGSAQAQAGTGGVSGSTSGESQTAQNSGCATGSATGAAIGGAMAGEGGAALGSMLGGLGKKKKKQGC